MKGLSQKGVTLIELLVVITIMMTMITLVGPLAMNTVAKAEAQSEYLSFCGTLRRASIKAFVNGSGIKLILDKNTLTAVKIVPTLIANQHVEFDENNILFERTYQYLNFSDTVINFNKNGIANLMTIKLSQGNRNREIDLIALLEN